MSPPHKRGLLDLTDKLNGLRIPCSISTIQLPGLLLFPDELNPHTVASITLLASEFSSADRLHLFQVCERTIVQGR